jgi:branched-chain amino acid transport system ATP-binding protein
MAEAARLAVEGLRLAFGGLQVLDDVHLAVPAGAIVALVGPNGAGKTSVLNCVNGIYHPQAGTVRLDGAPLPPGPPHRIARLGSPGRSSSSSCSGT